MHVSAFVFDGRKTAGKALETLEESGERRWLDEVAVVSRGKHGFVRVNSTWAQNDDDTAAFSAFGALTGGLIGALMGPQGALAGSAAAGALGLGSWYGLMGMSADAFSGDNRLEELGSRLKDDTSALVLVSDDRTAADFTSALKPMDAVLVETQLNEHDVKALREHLRANKARS